MSTRREFLKQSSLLAAGAVFSNKPFDLNFIKKPKIIILGAGLAGLAAGKLLLENGYDITILEARNRVGGRVFSHKIEGDEDLIIELGGEWIGKSHTNLISLCRQFGLELINNQFKDRLIYDDKFYNSGEWDYSAEWKEKFEKIIKNYSNLTLDDKKNLDKMDWWRFLMNHDISQRDLDIREYSDSTDFGESIRFVSAYAALAEYAESNSTNEMDYKVKGGNNKITSAIAERIGSEKIKLDRKVVSIDYNSDIKILCQNGEKFECDKLICALPTYSISKIMWNPRLPKNKIDAINSLQYSRINKSATIFKEKFWNDEAFSIITDTFCHYFYNGTKYQTSSKGVLISYAIGDKADMMYRLNDKDKENTITYSLHVAFGDIRHLIEKNINYYWGVDEYTKGAYALYGRNQWFTIRSILKEKLNNNIYFAGEHIADWQGFMEGAIETGLEAAKEIIQ